VIELLETPADDPWLKTPGRWRGTLPESGVRSANASCPKCGRPVSLSDHTIKADGTVEPSLVCAYDGSTPDLSPACEFHDNVRLVGWSP
jgi:hypothetical protein